tara:strand:+ start:818 stop:1177 length:360 start_codon:yes stop_codon:yes gene_type:complete
MSNAHSTWTQIVQELAELTIPEVADEMAWNAFIHRRELLLESLTRLKARGACPPAHALSSLLRKKLQAQCSAVSNALRTMNNKCNSLTEEKEFVTQSKWRLQRSVLHESSSGGTIRVKA